VKPAECRPFEDDDLRENTVGPRDVSADSEENVERKGNPE